MTKIFDEFSGNFIVYATGEKQFKNYGFPWCIHCGLQSGFSRPQGIRMEFRLWWRWKRHKTYHHFLTARKCNNGGEYYQTWSLWLCGKGNQDSFTRPLKISINNVLEKSKLEKEAVNTTKFIGILFGSFSGSCGWNYFIEGDGFNPHLSLFKYLPLSSILFRESISDKFTFEYFQPCLPVKKPLMLMGATCTGLNGKNNACCVKGAKSATPSPAIC